MAKVRFFFMKSLLFITCVLFIAKQTTFGQDSTKINAKQAIYFELGGTGIGISLNYDRLFRQTAKWKYGARVGVGINSGEFRPIPLGEIYALKGKRGKYLELGFGVSYLFPTKSQYTADTTLVTFRGGDQLWLIPRIGYRRQRNKKGNVFRAGITPVFILQSGRFRFYPYPGFSFGQSF